MSDGLFEKKAEFISWCIETYAAEHGLNGRDVANYFSSNFPSSNCLNSCIYRTRNSNTKSNFVYN